ncbi:MAG: aminotransferase class V-fold PLP-dependent enzyme [Opitutaceae bacterium]|jgi:cysteine desulfurase|nr:aminotransferase class V-fold PLP-dependent enzyme [Opitutaceae bacterium]
MPYFDHNATTPLADCARDIWLKVQAENWHNPSSPTRASARAKIRLDGYHEAVSVVLGGAPADYVFNSGATEGAHSVLAHWAASMPGDARIAVARTEHACVLAAAGRFFGGRIDWLPHDGAGVVSAETVAAAASRGARGVVVMAANNETGVLQPWPEIAEACRAADAAYLCDATQWLGKLPGAGLGACGAWVIASGHKFGAPKGVGIVKLPGGKKEPDFIAQGGGGQEGGRRAGTEDLAGMAAFCAALVECEQKHVIWESQRETWRIAFERALQAALPGTRILGADTDRLWNTVFAIMPAGEQARWVTKLDKRDVQVSTGAACGAGKDGPSHVLAALGVPPDEAKRALRFSAGWGTTEADWAALLQALRETAVELGAGPGA